MSREYEQHVENNELALQLLQEAGAIKHCESHGYLVETGPGEDAYRHFDEEIASRTINPISDEWYEMIIDAIGVLYDQAESHCPDCRAIGFDF